MPSPALYPHDMYGIGSQTPSLMVQNLESSLTFTLAIGCSPAPPEPRSSVTKSKMPSEACRQSPPQVIRGRQSRLLQSGKPLSPGTEPHNCSGPCSWAAWPSGIRQPGNEVPPLLITKSFMSSRKAKQFHFLAREAVDRTLACRVAREHAQARVPSSPTRCRR